MAKELRIAMIGYGFMGKTHSNAYRKANYFFPSEYRPVLQVLCARDAAKALGGGTAAEENKCRKCLTALTKCLT